jgi:hypothetical protein
MPSTESVTASKFGLVGSAIATLCAFIGMFSVSLLSLRKIIHFSLSVRKFRLTVFAGACTGAFLFFLRTALSVPLWWKVAISGILAWIFHKKAQTSCKSLIEWKV